MNAGAEKSLGKRIAHGSAWTAARHGLQQGVVLLQLVVVARLLAPEQVGLLAIATLIMTAARTLTETGFSHALIQRAELDDATLDAGFSVMLARALVLGTVIALLANAFASFFGEPAVAPLIRILALAAAAEGLQSASVLLLHRRLDFKKVFLLNAAGQIVGLLSTIALTYILRSVWAVAIGQLVGVVARVVASYALAPRPMHLRFDAAKTLELMRYGRWVGMSMMLLYALWYGDNFFVGKVLGAEALAYYNWAYQLATAPAILIWQVVSSVMMPAYASIQTQPERLRELYMRSLRLCMALTLPLSVLIAVLCEAFTLAILGPRWLPIVPLTHALCVYGALRAIGSSADTLLLAIGQPDKRTRVHLVQLLVLACSIWPLSQHFGVIGVAAAVTLYGIVHVFAIAYCLRRVSASIPRALTTFIQAASSAALGGAAAWLATRVISSSPPTALAVGGATGLIVYGVALSLSDRLTHVGYANDVQAILRALRKN